MPARAQRLALCLTLTLLPIPAAAQATGTTSIDTAALQRMLAAEDARGTGQGGLDPLIAALTGADTTLRRVAILEPDMMLRGTGALSPTLRASLVRRASADPSTIVRTEAIAAACLGDGPPEGCAGLTFCRSSSNQCSTTTNCPAPGAWLTPASRTIRNRLSSGLTS